MLHSTKLSANTTYPPLISHVHEAVASCQSLKCGPDHRHARALLSPGIGRPSSVSPFRLLVARPHRQYRDWFRHMAWIAGMRSIDDWLETVLMLPTCKVGTVIFEQSRQIRCFETATCAALTATISATCIAAACLLLRPIRCRLLRLIRCRLFMPDICCSMADGNHQLQCEHRWKYLFSASWESWLASS